MLGFVHDPIFSMWPFIVIFLIGGSGLTVVNSGPVAIARDQNDIVLGNCVWVGDRECPDTDIKFYLFTKKNPNDRQLIYATDSWDKSNLSASYFDAERPTKVIMHGFNSDMFLSSLIDMKDEYLERDDYNLFYIDYSDLARGPCYVQAVHNLRHVGKCLGLLLDRVLETGTKDVHLIGFSLGAQLANFAALAIRPYRLDRITGLDPAMPLFVGGNKDSKLDPTDAKFVDVYHTNAFVQGKVEQCGTADFYFNGGIIQPGCTTWKDNPVGCSHNRAPMYYMESIRTRTGFYAWPCNNYVMYLLRMCPASTTNLYLAGEDIRRTTKGMYFLKTRSESPFAMGRSNGNNRFRVHPTDFMMPAKRRDPLLEEIDQWGKLDGSFNNIDHFPTPLPQDPLDDWDYFGADGPSQIAQQNNYYYATGDRGGDEEEEMETSSGGPFGVQVLDVLHRKQSTNSHKDRRKRPPQKWRAKTRVANSTADDKHLIQRLWEDYNSAEVDRSAVPYWRRRQAYNNGDRQFFSQPIMRGRPTVESTRIVEEVAYDDEDTEVTTRQALRPGH